jgi:ABC-type branched-subunit amino acid transport system substrate-binding protein
MRNKVLVKVIGVVAVLALAAAACGSGDNSSKSSKKSSSAGGGPSPNAGKAPPSVPGFDGSTIKLGVVTPLTGAVSVIAVPLTSGSDVYWKAVNANGGVGGKYKVELKEEDSQYQTPVATQAYDKIKGDVVAFQQILGTQITKALLPKLQADNLSAAPATLDAEWVKNPTLFPIAGPYQIQAVNSLDYYINNGGKGKKICAIAQDDEFGVAGLQGLDYAAGKLNFKVAKTVKFTTVISGGGDVTAQIQQLSDEKCDLVFTVATAADASSILTKMIGLNFSPQVIALAPFWLAAYAQSPALQSFLVKHFWLASEGSYWGDPNIPGMTKMLSDVQKYKPDQKPDPYFAFGYAQAWAVDQILEKAVANGDLSKEGIQKASNEVGTLKFDGLTGDYLYGSSAADRNPARTSTVFKVDPSKPAGLDVLAPTFASDAAKSYKFPNP